MIIRALADAAACLGVPPPGYQVAATPWALTLSAAGRVVSLVPLQITNAKGKSSPLRQQVPKVSRTVNVAPQLACDTGVYCLGLAKPPAKGPYTSAAPSSRDTDCHTAWSDMVRAWATQSGGDPVAAAIVSWLGAGKPGLAEVLPSDSRDLASLASGNLAIYLEGDPIPAHLRPSALRFWAAHVVGAKTGQTGMCSSCGSIGPLVDTFPSPVPVRYAPGDGQTSGVALTSANFATASRRLQVTQLRNAPTCVSCAQGSVAALVELAAREDHRWTGEDSWTIWWLRSGATPSVLAWLDEPPEPADVAQMFDQLRAGNSVSSLGDLDDHYYALTYSARGPRIVIRAWVSGTLRATAEAIGAFLADSAVEQLYRPGRPWVPIWAMTKAAGERRARGGVIEHKAPLRAHEFLVRAALTQGYPPGSLLAGAVRRSRAEASLAGSSNLSERREHAHREHARACLVRLILTRSPHLNGGTLVPGPQLDVRSTDPAYLCGRLFAEYESAQRAAMGSDVNATITDRTYGKAMTNPVAVYPSIDRLSKAHLRKLRTSGKAATAAAIERRIGELVAVIPEIPAALDVPGQARWMLGYYQQRTANINAAMAATAGLPDSARDLSQDLTTTEEERDL